MSSSSVSSSNSQFTSSFFAESSRAWRANKRNVGQGYFRYTRNAFAMPPVRRSQRIMNLERDSNGSVSSVSLNEESTQGPRRSARLAALEAKKPSPPASSQSSYRAPSGSRRSARIAALYGQQA
jgi:hypothetical protein